jgi:predicted ATP-grasp superfamily ATP-dependent carboligase
MISGPIARSFSDPDVLVVGASARAAAFSALRAGFRPICLDHFADADLQAVAMVVAVGGEPEDVIAAADRFPQLPLVYAGGLENRPELLSSLAASRPLWGMNPDVLRAIRDPFAVAAALGSARLPCLEVCSSDSPPDADGQWMLKPLRSAGGQGIAVWNAEAAASPTLQRPHYFQRRIAGPSYSGVFIAQGAVGDVRFVGLTRQLIGEADLNAAAFAWCGNIGPVALSIKVESTIRRIANFLKWKFQLRGLFGVDFVLSHDEQIGVTEINPRYPASVEILEFATGAALFCDHVECFVEAPTAPAVEWSPLPGATLGKAVVYSPAKVTVNTAFPFNVEGFRTWPRHADVPAGGTVIRRGDPVLTVYAQGDSLDDCRTQLFERASRLLR